MPLSENEQRILRQIEEQLQRDPSFVRDLRPAASASRRSLIIAVVGGIVAIGLSILLLAVSPWLAFVAFVAAIAAVAYGERHLRVLGDEAMRQVAAMRRNVSGSAKHDSTD